MPEARTRASLLAVGLVALAAAGCGGSKQAAKLDAHGCLPVDAPSPTERSESKPTEKLDPSKRYDVTLDTNCGSFTVRLAVPTSPNTTASFANLVRKHFFDGTVFHRIVPGFVIQGGDPTQRGDGGPGYSTVDKPPAGTTYPHGLVAMAKTQIEPPGTAGSQFFVVTAKDAGLPPDYAVLGRVVKGLPVVDRIGTLGDANEQPTETVEIQHATLQTS
ncbi:MAG TPA: peptidylprolyl isomerase [Gaiellaceae bacterium]|nr:peptidylprolyl isomerase [Gaiellaceae bacterium]